MAQPHIWISSQSCFRKMSPCTARNWGHFGTESRRWLMPLFLKSERIACYGRLTLTSSGLWSSWWRDGGFLKKILTVPQHGISAIFSSAQTLLFRMMRHQAIGLTPVGCAPGVIPLVAAGLPTNLHCSSNLVRMGGLWSWERQILFIAKKPETVGWYFSIKPMSYRNNFSSRNCTMVTGGPPVTGFYSRSRKYCQFC